MHLTRRQVVLCGGRWLVRFVRGRRGRCHPDNVESGESMRVLLSSVGTRGDVQPVLSLALEVRRLGHEVRLCIPPNFVADPELECRRPLRSVETRPAVRREVRPRVPASYAVGRGRLTKDRRPGASTIPAFLSRGRVAGTPSRNPGSRANKPASARRAHGGFPRSAVWPMSEALLALPLV